MTPTPLQSLLSAAALAAGPLQGQGPLLDRLSVTAHTAADSLVALDGRRADAERVTLSIRHRAPAGGPVGSIDVV